MTQDSLFTVTHEVSLLTMAPFLSSRQVGFKPAGGIRTAKESLAWLSLVKEELGDEWLTPDLFRIGASSLLSDIERQVSEKTLSLEGVEAGHIRTKSHLLQASPHLL